MQNANLLCLLYLLKSNASWSNGLYREEYRICSDEHSFVYVVHSHITAYHIGINTRVSTAVALRKEIGGKIVTVGYIPVDQVIF